MDESAVRMRSSARAKSQPEPRCLLIGEVQTKSLNQCRIGGLLCNQRAARLRVAHLAQHTFHCPPGRRPLRFICQHDDRR